MAYSGFPRIEFNIEAKKKINLAGIFNNVLFLLETQDGYISDVTETIDGASLGTATPSGDVYGDMDVVIIVTTAGDLGTMAFKYSIDGGLVFSAPILSSATEPTVTLDYGLEVTFGGTAFVVDDQWAFFTKGGFRKRSVEKVTANNYQNLITNAVSKQYLDAFFSKADECYVISPPNDSAGSITPTVDQTGDGTATASGEPSRNATLKIQITDAGEVDSAKYIYLIDGVQISDVPTTLTEYVIIPETNTVIKFADGTPDSFQVDDSFTFVLTASGSSNILLALTMNVGTPTPALLNNIKMSSVFTNICIPTPLTLTQMNQMKYLVDQRQAQNLFAGYILQAESRGVSSVSSYKTALLSNVNNFKDYRSCICLDYLNTGSDLIPIWTPASVLLAQQIANYPVNVDAGQPINGSLDVVSRYDEVNMQTIELDLNDAGYTVVRLAPDSDGLYGYFFMNTQVLSTSNSTFRDYVDVRTFFKVLTLATYKLIAYLKKGIVANDVTLKSIGASIQNEILNAVGSEVSSMTFEIISTAEDFKETGEIECRTTVDTLELINVFKVNAILEN